MEILARARFPSFLAREAHDLRDSGCHKILKSDPSALSKAGGRWYIPPATSRPWPRVAFSGSPRTEATPLGVDHSRSGFSTRYARIYRGVEQPGSSSGS